MLALIAAGQPLTVATTTNQLMMTTALKELYAFLDVWEVDDNSKVTDLFKKANPGLQITAETAAGPIPIAETLDPDERQLHALVQPRRRDRRHPVAGCTMDPIVYPANAPDLALAALRLARWAQARRRDQLSPDGRRRQRGAARGVRLLRLDDGHHPPAKRRRGDDDVLRSTDPARRHELVLSIPRVGFFGTPAFFANWQTNTSNQMRVTMNQTLIVALGASVDGTDDTTAPQNPPPGLDGVHAAQPACLRCHQTLDPTRSIFAASYSWNYHDQLDTDLVRPAGRVRLPGSGGAGRQHERSREHARGPPVLRGCLGGEALLLRKLGALRRRRSGVPAAGHAVPVVGLRLEYAGRRAVRLAAHHQRRADGDHDRSRRDGGGVAP